MLRFALSPRWIVSHVLVAALIVGCVFAGLWQLDRLGERKDQNRVIEARSALAPVDVLTMGAGAALDPDNFVPPFDTVDWIPVTATGVFNRGEEVLVRNRPRDGAPGRWALTPLELNATSRGTGSGVAVIVNRGWLPQAIEVDTDRPEIDPPTTEVTVTGWLRPSEQAQGLQVKDPPDGVLLSVARPNIERLDQQTESELLPVFIQMETLAVDGTPTEGGLPAPLPLPALREGPHFSYAVQWFVFATIGFFGYPLVLWRLGRNRSSRQPAPETPATA